ncbi:MAG TPA: ATP-binding cassette domain-containing protein, partial [Deltaproteobacteria bacterium]|nr:ATP-binding cassette domain-containing protein [Deltaproteobacteria bacterium]
MIHMEKLTKYYGEVCAVDGIDLDIRKGEITGLLGPNGAGKTTTMRMLTGYLRPSSGTIRVRDLSVDADPLAVKKRMGYLPESAPLYANMLVYDYLLFVAHARGLKGDKARGRIFAMVELCSLSGIMHRPIGELSKGLRQRVGLAHAMMDDPEILVLDEPTSGLDPNQIVEIRDIIRSFGRDKTIILSTHILSEAQATCDRIVIIDKGKIVADGSTEVLTYGLGEGRSLRLVLAGADLEAARSVLAPVEGVVSVEGAQDAGPGLTALEVRYLPGSDPRPEIYRRIKATDWVILEMAPKGVSL